MMSKQQSLLSHSSGTASDLPPMAITTMQFSGESSSLAIGNSAGLVLLFKFSSKEMDIVMQVHLICLGHALVILVILFLFSFLFCFCYGDSTHMVKRGHHTLHSVVFSSYFVYW